MTIINGTRNEIGIDSDAYPKLLQRIDHAPETIYVVGDQSALDLPMLAVTGARRATPYGIACAERFAEIAAGRGLCVVTGGALGIDAAAMEAALESGGKCVAALAQGLDTDAYPDGNAHLLQRIVDAGARSYPSSHGASPRCRGCSGLATAS